MSEPAGSRFVYVTFIRTTPEALWAALTDPDTMTAYWFGVRGESDWTAGSSWRLVFKDGRVTDTGEIVEADRPRRLAIRWRNEFMPDLKAEGHSPCTFELEPAGDVVKLTVAHTIGVEGSKLIEGVSSGWPRILSNLKSLLETGRVAMTE